MIHKSINKKKIIMIKNHKISKTHRINDSFINSNYNILNLISYVGRTKKR